jgi:hypothetical protein
MKCAIFVKQPTTTKTRFNECDIGISMIKSINKDDQGCIGTRKGYNNK